MLRGYQQEAISDVYKFFRSGIRSVMLYAPTGAGKTVIASQIIADALSKGSKVLFLVHRTKLIDQTINALKKHNIDIAGIGVFSPHCKPNYNALVHIGMVQTIQNRQLPDNIGLVILDECHTTSYYTIWQKVINHYSGGIMPLSKCFFLGLSASPWRTKAKEGFCQYFQALVKAPYPKDLIQNGFLVSPRHFGWGGRNYLNYDLLKVDNTGEFSAASLAKVCNDEYNTKIVKVFKDEFSSKKAIAFCASVAQAKNLSYQLQESGFAADCIIGDTPESDREAIYKNFKEGKIQVLVSVGVLCEGFDDPSCNAVILARPTNSLALLIQMCGRGLRIYPGKSEVVLLDFGGNFTRKGLITKNHEISLCPPRKKKIQMDMSKECPNCHEIVPIFAKICPECGHVFKEEEEEERPDTYPHFGEILDKEDQQKLGYLRGQLLKAYKRGIEGKGNGDLGRVYFLYTQKYGTHPPHQWYRDAIFRRGAEVTNTQRQIDILQFTKYLNRPRKNGQMPNDVWIKEQLKKEFPDKWSAPAIKWWEILGVPINCRNWIQISAAYREKVKVINPEDANLLNYCLDEAREFCQ